MRESRVLGKLYRDEMNVYRRSVMKNEDGESVFSKRLVYENIPCGLSLSSASSPRKNTIAADSSSEYVIFAQPLYSIQDDDYVEVTTSMGEVLKGKVGKSFMYPSHIECSLLIEKVV